MRNSAIKLFSPCVLSLLVCLYATSVMAVAEPVAEAPWNYQSGLESNKWHTSTKFDYKKCDDDQQSPIDIRSSEAVEDYLGKLGFANYGLDLKGGKVGNDGRSLKVVPDTTVRGGVPLIFGAGLKGQYYFGQLHFHWGSKTSQGSEHLVDGKAYPMELHLVHYNSKYADMAAAKDKEDGLAVLGVFFHLSSTDNPHLQTILDHIPKLPDKATTGWNTAFSKSLLLNSLLPSDTDSFYRYFGSLTTPSCDESVTWTVLEKTIPVSLMQLGRLRTLIDVMENGMEDNFRPVQPLNRRIVVKSKPPTTKKEEDKDTMEKMMMMALMTSGGTDATGMMPLVMWMMLQKDGSNSLMSMLPLMMSGGTDANGMMPLMTLMILQQGSSNNMLLPMMLMLGNGSPTTDPSGQQQQGFPSFNFSW